MKNSLFVLVFLSAAFAVGASAADFVVGGKPVSPRDPITDSTVGVYSPNPDGTGGSLCTGTLIQNGIAVTAAHCIESGVKPTLIFNRDLKAPGAARREAQEVAVNPRWASHAGKGMDQGDIALVKFNGRLPSGYKPVPTLGSDSSLRPGEDITLAGYGINNAKTKAGAGLLRKARVKVRNPRHGKPEMILDQTHGRGACHGDSGGPAFVRSGKGIALAGLTNRGYPDSAPDDCAHDVVYTKVPAYQKWIQHNEKRMESRPPARALRAPRRVLRLSQRRSPRPHAPRSSRRVASMPRMHRRH